MLIEGTIKSNKTQILAGKYTGLVKSGIRTEEILVLCLNSMKKQQFIERIQEDVDIHALDNPNIYTFYGLCRNAVADNWPIFEGKIKDNNRKILPNLCGLELSQYILKNAIKKTGFKDYPSKINLLHQLFRRNSLIIQNCLDDKEVKRRSRILNEAFAEDAQNALNIYKAKTVETRSFDYLRQLSMLNLALENTDYFKKIKYLMIDDADEITYIVRNFIDSIKPQLKEIFIAYDTNGASRCGYLSAYKTGVYEFEKLFNETKISLKSNDFISLEAEKLYETIKCDKKLKSDLIQTEVELKRLDMFDRAVEKIKKLAKNGVSPSEISVVTPIIDTSLKFSIKQALKDNGLSFQIISGSEKLCENTFVKNSINIIKLSNQNWNLNPDELELRGIFSELLKIPLRHCYDILQSYKKEFCLKEFDFKDETHNNNYQKLRCIIDNIEKTKPSLSKQLLYIYENFCDTGLKKEDYNKFSFLLKEIEGFEEAFGDDENTKKEFIIQIENTVISETPAGPTEIEPNSIIISTPQKIIDYEIKTKYQIWLDISSNEWLKQDIGPLYNAWVFNADWHKDEFTYEDNLRLTKEKTARVLRKLMLCSDEKIFAFASFYDSLGNENFGGISDFFETENNTETQKKSIKIIPREDQKPVLEYKGGKMGIMAVPGAGKTTILLALIIKMLRNGIRGENIFVLTYMDAAARNLKERITNLFSQNIELPNISTIHGLALRIIKENSNYSVLNLPDDFEICDDNQKQKIIYEILSKFKIDTEKYESYEKSISAIKLSAKKFNLYSKYKDIKDFIKFFNEYNKTLRLNNLIDYDDMLNLAVELLEKKQDILGNYQNICQYIIEDEAQDSSPLQQKLISLLGAKNGNIIRCGDINQSITTTFTNSDVQGFKDFIEKSQKVEMVSSQRCSKPIYELANRLIETTQKIPGLKNSFYNIRIIPAEFNPKSNFRPVIKTFEKEADEKLFILKQIKNIMQKNPNITIGLLLRNNYQVNEYGSFLNNNGLKTITRTDCLGQKQVFRLILSILKFIQKPYNNKILSEMLDIYEESLIFPRSETVKEFLKNLKTPFITMDLSDIENSDLDRLYWEANYWLNNSYLPLDEICIKIGLNYFKTAVEKSNIYLISTLIKRLASSYKSTDTIIEKLEDISKRSNLSGYKFFNEEEIPSNKTAGRINIMTVHKSKGDEFDVVFIPKVDEESFSTSEKTTKIKNNAHFIETIKNLEPGYKRKTPQELKQMQIEENLRLLYVGITRAKEQLYLTCAQKYLKSRTSKPNELLKTLETQNA